jgi:osmotically-inducible protein OsmY
MNFSTVTLLGSRPSATTEEHKSRPILKAANLRAAVDDSSVTLTGVVDNEQEHQIALGIAASYAGKRNIVGHIKIRS